MILKMPDHLRCQKKLLSIYNYRSSRPEVFRKKTWEISKNTFSYRAPQMAASGTSSSNQLNTHPFRGPVLL